VSSERDKRAEEYRTKAQQSRDKASAMLNDQARQLMLDTADMWEAMAKSIESKRE
jgi:hypothetical protein